MVFKIILKAGMLVREPGPRYAIHGGHGTHSSNQVREIHRGATERKESYPHPQTGVQEAAITEDFFL